MNALIISAVLGVVMMFSGIVLKQNSAVRSVAFAGIIILLLVNSVEMCGTVLFKVDINNLIAFNRFTLVFNSIAFGATFIYLLLTAEDMEKVGKSYAEYFALIFFVLCGVVLVTSFKSLLILFLGIEIITIPLYILTGSDKRNLRSNEASLKYFLLGSFSTGIMLMGIALIYGHQGNFSTEGVSFLPEGVKPSVLLVAGMLLMLFAMAFKVSAVPFHFWTPDVYDGTPTVFTSFMATIVKAAVFIAFIRLFEDSFGALQSGWQFIVALIIAATLLVGNITAVFQQSVKRMLAYSSISQAGFMLFALFALNTVDAKEGIILYAAAYSLATIGIFAVLNKLGDYSYEGFNGLSKEQPLLAGTAVVFLLSLAGIPLTAGFLSKFYMLKAALGTGKYLWLVIFAVLMAAVSVYYYFRVIQAMYFKDSKAQVPVSASAYYKVGLVLVAFLIILLGVYPEVLLSWLYF